MNKQEQPGIKTEAIILLESNFIRYPVHSGSIEPKVKISYSKNQAQEGTWHGILSAVVTAVTGKEEKVFEARIRYLGVFAADPENENLNIEEFMGYHAPAHIFPYLREYLTNLSTRSGLPPIILPPVNMAALIETEMEGKIEDNTIEPEVNQP